MKKTLSLLLLIALLGTLCACGHSQAAPVTPSPAPTTEGVVSATDTSSTPQASSTDTDAQSHMQVAQNYIGRETRDMYAAIGEPVDSAYSASQDQPGSEDGMLIYDGFFIWTLRTGESEIVQEVYPE